MAGDDLHTPDAASPLDAELRKRLSALVHGDRVVVFMKGTPQAPRCGFSARVVELLDGLLDARDPRDRGYTTVDILEDDAVRQGMKAYAQWPTFPQVWVEGEFLGGADIVEEMHERGTLAAGLGVKARAGGCTLFLTPEARGRIRAILAGRTHTLRLVVDEQFQYRFEHVDTAAPADHTVEIGDIVLVLDPASARRADGMTMDYVEDDSGAGMVVDNPNEPAPVLPLDVEAYADWKAQEPHLLLDVRTPEERAIAVIPGARLLDEDTATWLGEQPRDTRLVFACHHGVRSLVAAEHFARQGFTEVFNLEGGIDAWSRWVDPSVRRY